MTNLFLDAAGLTAFLLREFPAAAEAGIVVESADDEGVSLVYEPTERDLRPGNTVSGPTLMMLADTAVYLALLSRIGPVALAVTSSLEVHFLRKAALETLRVRAVLPKLGRALAVGTFSIRDSHAEIALGTVTYAIPSSARG